MLSFGFRLGSFGSVSVHLGNLMHHGFQSDGKQSIFSSLTLRTLHLNT